MKSRPLQFKSLMEISRMIHRAEVTSATVTTTLQNQIAASDGDLHSYIHLCPDRAQKQAAKADAEIAAGIHKGPLHGVPIAVKDLC